MTSSVEEHADESSRRLRELVARGFRLMPPVRDSNGELEALIYVRPQADVVDLVEVRAEDDARAARVRRHDNHVGRSAVLWQTTGSTCSVLDEVLALPGRLFTAPA
ncbi:hypothetical protein GCM10011581_39070 [Saccharopolyspora subtropica]|uniref:Uncharacterized protein n=1 Tax=Saccharopolyspora thermophila TaxID=89367 RepID=A0A917K3Y4_9PSEU|nr:hypothetical protein [Saccharopolyspora subtropica]GGI98089.1 hypothetical protein GCM10011581_39070 [Saccharopolyspora subtropica]